MFINKIKIRHVLPCIADSEKIRIIAYFEKNVSEVFPFMNRILDGAIYNHDGKTLTIKKEGRLITLHPNKLAATKITDEEDAHQIINWVKDKINYCYENKDSIEPSFDRRQKLSVLDIFKLIPGTNCKKCGELTCMAFAVRLSEEEIGIMKCVELFSGNFTDKRNELLRLLKASGYDFPKVLIFEK